MGFEADDDDEGDDSEDTKAFHIVECPFHQGDACNDGDNDDWE